MVTVPPLFLRKCRTPLMKKECCGLMKLFLGCTNTANRRTAVRTFALGDRLSVLGNAFNRIYHFFLSLALYAVCFNCHIEKPLFFNPGVVRSRTRPKLSNGTLRQRYLRYL